LRFLSRRVIDTLARLRFAMTRADIAEFNHLLCQYDRPLICYPGQEAHFDGKRHNTELVLSAVDGLLIRPGETFSFWQAVGRPSARAGFRPAAALKDRRLVEDVGGAICLPSTLLYNAGLLAGLTILERHCHSVDSYGSRRYFELGRDAAVEYPYRDLRFRNVLPVPVMLTCSLRDDHIHAEVRSATALDISVEIEVADLVIEQPRTIVRADTTLESTECIVDRSGSAGVSVRTMRRITTGSLTRVEELGLTVHHPDPREMRVGTARLARTSAD
jgi:vancomycin resistance protein VanW